MDTTLLLCVFQGQLFNIMDTTLLLGVLSMPICCSHLSQLSFDHGIRLHQGLLLFCQCHLLNLGQNPFIALVCQSFVGLDILSLFEGLSLEFYGLLQPSRDKDY